MKIKLHLGNIFTYFMLIIGLLLILGPLYLTIVTSFKSAGEISRNFFALPQHLYLENYKKIFFNSPYFHDILNTIYIAVISLTGMCVILPMTSYPIARSMNGSRVYRLIYYFFIMGLFIPFQVKMMPLINLVSAFGMMNRTGLAVLYIISSLCQGVFLYVGYIASLPVELEEAAYIDGASTLTCYTKIILPLLKPITATIMILNGLWVWNDFMMPLLVLNRSSLLWTVTLFQYNFRSEYSIDYNLVFATFVGSILPIFILYVFLQKYIISGLTSGAVKE